MVKKDAYPWLRMVALRTTKWLVFKYSLIIFLDHQIHTKKSTKAINLYSRDPKFIFSREWLSGPSFSNYRLLFRFGLTEDSFYM